MFNELTFTWPESLADINSSFGNSLNNANTELQSASSRHAAALSVDVVNNPVASASIGASANLSLLVDALLSAVNIACVHPWQQGIGQGENHYRYLSPENAVSAAADKFVDSHDVNLPASTVDAVVIVLSANSFAGLANTLNKFNVVFPVCDLLLCERRAIQLTTLENDKTTLPLSALNSRWKKESAGGVGLTKKAVATIGEFGAHAFGYEQGGITPDDELQGLIAKKQSAINSAANAVNSVASIFSGGSGRGVFLKDKTPEQLKTSLINSGLGHGEPLACCLVLTGAAGELDIFAEMLGL